MGNYDIGGELINLAGLKKESFMEITYDKIKSLIVHEEVRGSQVFVEFQTPGGEVIESRASIRRDNSVGSAVMRNVKRTAMTSARSSIGRMVRGILGGGFLGRIGSQTVNTASREMVGGRNNEPSQKEIENAVVDAFKRVQRHFDFNERGGSGAGSWGRSSTPAPQKMLNEFEQIATHNPVRDAHDQKVLSRVLAEIANADGTISPEEEDFFKSIIPAGQGSVRELMSSERVSAVEAQMVSAGVKETIYLFAWAIALSDFNQNENEARILNNLATTFGLRAGRRDDLILIAKKHILEQAIDGETAREELFELADQIGLNRDDAERVKIEVVRKG